MKISKPGLIHKLIDRYCFAEGRRRIVASFMARSRTFYEGQFVRLWNAFGMSAEAGSPDVAWDIRLPRQWTG